jgi:acylphosphatase
MSDAFTSESEELDGVVFNEDGSVTVVLDYPVKKGKEMIDEIVFSRRLTLADMEAADRAGGDVSQAVVLAAGVSGEPLAVIRRVDFADAEKISFAVEHFTKGKRSRTGGGR